MELLTQAGAYVIGMKRPDGKKLMLGMKDEVPAIDAHFDLRQHGLFRSVRDAVMALIRAAIGSCALWASHRVIMRPRSNRDRRSAAA